MSLDLRNALWNLTERWWNSRGDTREISGYIWSKFLKRRLDEIQGVNGEAEPFIAWMKIRSWYVNSKWWEAFDFIEFLTSVSTHGTPLETAYNAVLAEELAPYRFVGKHLTQLTNDEEIEEVRRSLDSGERFSAVRTHIETALTHFNDRKTRDFRNSVKESISAVEAASKIVSGKPNATLTEALKALETSGKMAGEWHNALLKGFGAIYGYSSDASGIRHALKDQAEPVSQEDARFFLIACSAFSNYLISLTS